MNDVQNTLMELRKKGWTLAAISKELNIPANTLRKWSAGLRYPANSSTVKASLLALSQRKAGYKARRRPVQDQGVAPGLPKARQRLSPEVRAGLGLFKDLAPGRSLADELVQQRREEAARE